jgi:hypothetical protein
VNTDTALRALTIANAPRDPNALAQKSRFRLMTLAAQLSLTINPETGATFLPARTDTSPLAVLAWSVIGVGPNERAAGLLFALLEQYDAVKAEASGASGAGMLWDDCKVAFGVGDGGAIWNKFEKPLWRDRLPAGWIPNEANGAGARWVLVFRVERVPTVEDGRAVSRLLKRMEPR